MHRSTGIGVSRWLGGLLGVALALPALALPQGCIELLAQAPRVDVVQGQQRDLRLAVPSLSNSLISLIKDTSLISVITVTELMLATKEVIAETFQPLPLYLAAAGIYWLLSALFERVQKALENRLTAPLRR